MHDVTPRIDRCNAIKRCYHLNQFCQQAKAKTIRQITLLSLSFCYTLTHCIKETDTRMKTNHLFFWSDQKAYIF